MRPSSARPRSRDSAASRPCSARSSRPGSARSGQSLESTYGLPLKELFSRQPRRRAPPAPPAPPSKEARPPRKKQQPAAPRPQCGGFIHGTDRAYRAPKDALAVEERPSRWLGGRWESPAATAAIPVYDAAADPGVRVDLHKQRAARGAASREWAAGPLAADRPPAPRPSSARTRGRNGGALAAAAAASSAPAAATAAYAGRVHYAGRVTPRERQLAAGNRPVPFEAPPPSSTPVHLRLHGPSGQREERPRDVFDVDGAEREVAALRQALLMLREGEREGLSAAEELRAQRFGAALRSLNSRLEGQREIERLQTGVIDYELLPTAEGGRRLRNHDAHLTEHELEVPAHHTDAGMFDGEGRSRYEAADGQAHEQSNATFRVRISGWTALQHVLESKTLSVAAHQFRISIYPNGIDKHHTGYVGAFCVKLSGAAVAVKVEVSIRHMSDRSKDLKFTDETARMQAGHALGHPTLSRTVNVGSLKSGYIDQQRELTVEVILTVDQVAIAAATAIQASFRGMRHRREQAKKEEGRRHKAATVLQRMIRSKTLAKRLVAAAHTDAVTSLQAIRRGVKDRKQVAEKHEASARISANYKGYQERRAAATARVERKEHSAATAIQNVHRQKLAKRKVMNVRHEQEQQKCAVQIQSAFRGKSSRQEQRNRRRAAKRISAVFRGQRTRDRIIRQRQEHTELVFSAMSIQAGWRGRCARKLAAMKTNDHTWRFMLTDFSKGGTLGYLCTPAFKAGGQRWTLRVYPDAGGVNKGVVAIFLVCMGRGKCRYESEITIHSQTVFDGTKDIRCHLTADFKDTSPGTMIGETLGELPAKTAEKEGYLAQDALSVSIRVTAFETVMDDSALRALAAAHMKGSIRSGSSRRGRSLRPSPKESRRASPNEELHKLIPEPPPIVHSSENGADSAPHNKPKVRTKFETVMPHISVEEAMSEMANVHGRGRNKTGMVPIEELEAIERMQEQRRAMRQLDADQKAAHRERQRKEMERRKQVALTKRRRENGTKQQRVTEARERRLLEQKEAEESLRLQREMEVAERDAAKAALDKRRHQQMAAAKSAADAKKHVDMMAAQARMDESRRLALEEHRIKEERVALAVLRKKQAVLDVTKQQHQRNHILQMRKESLQREKEEKERQRLKRLEIKWKAEAAEERTKMNSTHERVGILAQMALPFRDRDAELHERREQQRTNADEQRSPKKSPKRPQSAGAPAVSHMMAHLHVGRHSNSPSPLNKRPQSAAARLSKFQHQNHGVVHDVHWKHGDITEPPEGGVPQADTSLTHTPGKHWEYSVATPGEAEAERRRADAAPSPAKAPARPTPGKQKQMDAAVAAVAAVAGEASKQRHNQMLHFIKHEELAEPHHSHPKSHPEHTSRRGRLETPHAKARREQRDALTSAAIKVQAHFRGHVVRAFCEWWMNDDEEWVFGMPADLPKYSVLGRYATQ